MRNIGLAAVAGIAFATVSLSGSAALAMGFGADENIHAIQDIEGTEYRLCHKTTLHFFILGIYLTDDGYVLQERGMYGQYLPLEDAEIRGMQAEGLLPNPLPEYSIPILEYVFGYSLWIVIAFAIACAGVAEGFSLFSKGRRVRALLADPDYKKALTIALNAEGNGINEAVDYLHGKGVPVSKAQTNMQLLLSKGTTISI